MTSTLREHARSLVRKQQLREELTARRSIGRQMANLCFNLSQSEKIPAEYRTIMRELCERWDAIKRSEEPQ